MIIPFVSLIALMTPLVVCQSENRYAIKMESPANCIVEENAEYHQYYDTSGLKCTTCTQNSSIQTVSADALRCVCREEYRITSSLGHPGQITCEKCPPGQIASRDGWNCVTCSMTSPNTCPNCTAKNTLPADRNLTGHWLNDATDKNTLTCVTCLNETAPGISAERCLRCNQQLSVQPNQSCICPEDRQAGGLCYGSSQDLLDASELNYFIDYNDTVRVRSGYLVRYLRSAQASCTNFTESGPTRLDYSNLTSCQQLANMCVMTLYSTRHDPPHPQNDPCSLYLRLVRSYPDSTYPPHGEGSRAINNRIRSWRANMPWLYYLSEVDDDPETVLNDASIDQIYSRGSYLELSAEEYSLGGQYLGRTPLNNVPLTLCKLRENELLSAFKYGTSYKKTCSLSVESLFTSSDMPQNFYELYLNFISNKNNQLLHAVPLLLTNYISPRGIPVNQEDDVTQWQLLRRYFLIDRVTGMEENDNTPSVVRYLRETKIHIVQQSTSSPGLIYPPYVEMTYDYVTTNQLAERAFVKVSITADYQVDLTPTHRNMSIAMGVVSALSLAVAVFQTSNWSRRQGKISVDYLTVIRFLTYTAGTLADGFFLCVFGYALWMLILYKAPSEVFVVPDERLDFYVKAYIGSAFCLKFINLVQLIITQSTVTVFFVDWERGSKPEANSKQQRQQRGSEPEGATSDNVSMWRRVMVANEWAELQVERRIKPFWQLVLMMLLLEVLGLENLARLSPDTRLRSDFGGEPPPQSILLRFALSSALYIGLAFIQLIFHKFWTSFVRDPMMNFVDLCSMANVSVFLLPYNQYGYYIHGRSAHGRADVSSNVMFSYLHMEEQNLCGHRGLEPGSDVQTFEIFIPAKLRAAYRRLLFSLHFKQVTSSQTSKTVCLDPETKRRLRAYDVINKLLQSYIDHNLKGIDYIITEKNLFQRMLNYESIEEFDGGYFFVDGGHKFDDVLFYGQELLLVIFEILTFSVADILSGSVLISALTTYLFIQIIILIRQAGGKRNLANKTMIEATLLS